MKFTPILLIAGLSTMTDATSLRRSLASPCSAAELSENACGLPDGTIGATVCRHGFTACIHREDHDSDDVCGVCPPPPEEPRAEPVDTPDSPLCADVDLSSFACEIDDGTAGVMICHEGFSACVPEETVEDEDACGCCFGDSSPRCQLEEEARFIDAIVVSTSIVCDALQMEEYACELPGMGNSTNSTMGAYVCRGGFTACVPAKDHLTGDVCGICPVVEVPEEPRAEPAEIDLPLCSTVALNDFVCSLPGGQTGALVCHEGFSACRNIEAVQDDDFCGCCPGDDSPRCLGTPTALASKSGSP